VVEEIRDLVIGNVARASFLILRSVIRASNVMGQKEAVVVVAVEEAAMVGVTVVAVEVVEDIPGTGIVRNVSL